MVRLRLLLALVIAVMWASSYIVSVATHDYTGVSLITPLMLMVAGWLLTTGRNDGNG